MGERGIAITRWLWVQIAGSMNVQDVAIDAATQTFYAAVIDMVHPENGGIYASKNGARNTKWSQPEAAASMHSNMRNRSTRATTAARVGSSVRVLRSGMLDSPTKLRSTASPANPLVLYAGANGTGAGLYKSVDGGRNWTRPTTRAITVNPRDGSRSDSKQGAVDEIVVDPADGNILIATFDGAFAKSNDRGPIFSDCLRMGARSGAGAPPKLSRKGGARRSSPIQPHCSADPLPPRDRTTRFIAVRMADAAGIPSPDCPAQAP